jgi:hypothetical protein
MGSARVCVAARSPSGKAGTGAGTTKIGLELDSKNESLADESVASARAIGIRSYATLTVDAESPSTSSKSTGETEELPCKRPNATRPKAVTHRNSWSSSRGIVGVECGEGRGDVERQGVSRDRQNANVETFDQNLRTSCFGLRQERQE